MIDVISVIFGMGCALIGAGVGIMATKRNYKQDVAKDTSEITTVVVRLETVVKDLTELKAEMRADIRNIRDGEQDNRERIIKLEGSNKSAWRQIDILTDKQNKEG